MNAPINPAGQLSEKEYMETPIVRAEHREDTVTRLIEQQAAKIPSNYFLVVSLATMGASLFLELSNKERLARFVGMWPAPILLLGIYNKIVKTSSLV